MNPPFKPEPGSPLAPGGGHEEKAQTTQPFTDAVRQTDTKRQNEEKTGTETGKASQSADPGALKPDFVFQNPGNSTISRSYDVATPTLDLRDYIVQMSGNRLNSLRTDLESQKDKSSFWKDVFLALFGLFGGAFIASYCAGVKMDSSWGSAIAYTISPVISVGSLVAFFYNTKYETSTRNAIIERVLKDIPGHRDVTPNRNI